MSRRLLVVDLGKTCDCGKHPVMRPRRPRHSWCFYPAEQLGPAIGFLSSPAPEGGGTWLLKPRP